MKLANDEIEQWLYTTLGDTFSDGTNTWKYYTVPPKEGIDRYVYSKIELLLDEGTKSDYMGRYLMSLTIVDRTGANFTDNKAANLCSTYLGQTFDVRGRQVALTSFNLVSVRLTTNEDLTDRQAQETVIIRKLIFSILAEEI